MPVLDKQYHNTTQPKQWSLQDAKARFSKVVNQALAEGPQHITRHGHPAVVVLAEEDYARMTEPREDLTEFFANSPLKGLDLDNLRDHDTGREVIL